MRSAFEARVAAELDALGIDVQYEAVSLPYTPKGRRRVYTPDFILPNGIALELKGFMSTDDRNKYRAVRDTYPDLDLRFVLLRAGVPVTRRKGSSIEGWCRRNGFPVAIGSVPVPWLVEPANPRQMAIIDGLRVRRREAA